MRRIILTFLLAMAPLAAGAASAVQAHEPDFLMHRPYAIQKTCNDHFRRCKVKMIYAPGQHAGLAGAGSYWYRKSPGARKHGDFTLRSPKAHAHKHHAKRKYKHHVKYAKGHHHGCRKVGWAFSTSGLHFVSGVPKSQRCIRSYDWR
jgi:hypothetical protein